MSLPTAVFLTAAAVTALTLLPNLIAHLARRGRRRTP